MKQHSFEWRGRTKQGVSKWVGSEEGPPRLLGKIFTRYGIAAGIGGLALALYGLTTGALPQSGSILMMIGLIHGVVFTGIGQWVLSFRRTIQRLKPVETVAQQMQMDTPTIERLAELRGIKPRVNINGRDYFEIADFNDAKLLLRASSKPAAGRDTLLRAASADTNPASDHLLRATSAEPASRPTQEWKAEEQNHLLEIRPQSEP